METFEFFENQDLENGDFDVVFELNGKEIYANKFMLSSASPTFKSMLSNRWRKTDEPIEIKDYSYEEFKEFLTFLYAGECSLTPDNIFAMVDMAEFYGVTVFKNVCDEYLTKLEINVNNVYQMIEIANKYSMIQFKKSIYNFISDSLFGFFQSEQFLNLETSVLKDIIKSNHGTIRQDELFEAVFEVIFKWLEYQMNDKQKLIDSMKLTDYLTFIKPEKIDSNLLIKFIERNPFLFTDEELQKLLLTLNKVYVKVIDENGKIMKGQLQCPDIEQVADTIIRLENVMCCRIYDLSYHFWETRQPQPVEPSKLIQIESVEWYLVYDCDGDIAIKKRSQLDNEDYLLAEMIVEEEFEFYNNDGDGDLQYKIKI
uniref:BTB domain-containing protein n=1 Tax=Panagrolaimus sp. ES5 TaxID=591445 RepID=A0AC34FA17_9BILA